MSDETTGTGAATTTTPTTTTAAATTTPAVSTTGFDWKAVGVDDAGLNLVNDRQWKTPADLLKSYTNLEKLTGVPADKLIRVPKDNDPKAWDEVYAKLGRPDAADKYVIPVPDGQPKEFAGEAAKWFHEAGLPQSAVTKIAEKWNGFVEAQQKAAQEKQAQEQQIQVNALKKAWGADYDKQAQVVDRAAETFGMTQEHLSALKQVLGPKAAMEFLHKIGSKIAVEATGDPAGMNQRGDFAMTPEQAKAKISQLKHDKSFAQLFVSQDPKQRMDARAEMDRLHKLAYPGVTDYSGSPSRA
jgi:SpoVK/Ycf46/Vps4 family AAA+-type ATPase